MNKFSDSSIRAYPADQAPPPNSVGGLLGVLGVFTASREKQRQAIERWLRDNEPSAFLRMGLEHDGFIAPSRPARRRAAA